MRHRRSSVTPYLGDTAATALFPFLSLAIYPMELPRLATQQQPRWTLPQHGHGGMDACLKLDLTGQAGLGGLDV